MAHRPTTAKLNSLISVTFRGEIPHAVKPFRPDFPQLACTHVIRSAARVIAMTFCILVTHRINAQIIFSANNLPSSIGEFSDSYYSSNIDVTSYLALATNINAGGSASGPPIPESSGQAWDFSQNLQSNELLLQTDFLGLSGPPDTTYFPTAAYAEQDTINSHVIGRRYYSLANSGREYYGLYESVSGASAQVVFTPPCIDIPAVVGLNQTWTNQLSWTSLYFQLILISNYLSDTAVVDAFGTLALPQIGVVPALRVHETHSYSITEVADPPLLLDIHTNEYYYWLVPNLGIAAEVEILGNNVLSSISLPCTNTLQRMYFANYFTNTFAFSAPAAPPFATNLAIQTVGNTIILNWQSFSNYVDYRVDYTEGLTPQAWQPLNYTSATLWTDSVNAVQRFYRVVGLP